MPSVTMMRDEAVQRWPVPKKAPSIAQVTARSRSASSRTTSGFLPPISSCTRACRLIAPWATRAPDALRAGEGDAVDIRMVDDCASDAALADDEVEDARRRTGFVDDGRQRMRNGRRRSRRLHHDGVAEGQRRRGLPRRNRDREIPRRDHAVDADRLAIGRDVQPGPRRVQRLAVAAYRLAGEIFEDASRAHDFAGTFGERLAFLARQQFAEFLGTLHDDVAGAIEDVRANFRRCLRPGGERGPRGLHGAIHILRLRLRITCDDVVEIGRVDALAGGIGCNRLAADKVRESARHYAVFSNKPRDARFCINAPIPNSHGFASFEVVTRFTRDPSLGAEMRTTSPILCVNPRPGSSRSSRGSEQGAEEQRKAVRIMMLAQRLADEFFGIAADLAHQAAASEDEAVLAFDLQLDHRVPDVVHRELVIEQTDERANRAGRIIVLGLAEQKRAAPFEIAQVHVVAERRAADFAVAVHCEHDFRLRIVPAGVRTDADVRAPSDAAPAAPSW